MASALWSSPTATVMDFPARYLAQFMANHQMLQMTGRAPWRVVSGGSARYVDALRARWRVHERLECPVQSVERMPWGARVHTAGVEASMRSSWPATATRPGAAA
jgi:predicted NAD/FAD-binding protein